MKKTFFKKVTWFGICGILAVSLIPNIFSDYWLIDIFSHFKVQYLFISFLLLIISGLLLKRNALAYILIGISILWNAYYIAPYYINANDAESKTNNTFKISSINLLSNNSETDLVIQYINKENPDILVLMELTPRWERNLQSILEKYPYKRLVTRNDNFGIALFSKFEMNSAIDDFGFNNKPSIIGDLIIANTKYTLVATHPIPPINQSTFNNRNKQLANIINKRPLFSENLIIVGDFNTSSFSNHFGTLVKGDLKDSRMGFGLLPTWPVGFGIMQTTLDHCLVSKNIKVLHRSTGEYIGSDHKPITIVLGID